MKSPAEAGAVNVTKRQIIKAAGAAAVASAFASRGVLASRHHDLLIIGAGTAGIPAAIFAAARGASVLVIDVAPIIGGTLTMATGQISAAGTRIQKQLGIEDSADLHFEDLMRISRGTIDQPLVRVAVDNAADTVDWLFDHGYEILPGYPVRGIAHEPYSRRRYYWSASQGMGILEEQK